MLFCTIKIYDHKQLLFYSSLSFTMACCQFFPYKGISYLSESAANKYSSKSIQARCANARPTTFRIKARAIWRVIG